MVLFPAVILLGGVWYHRNEDGVVQQIIKKMRLILLLKRVFHTRVDCRVL